MIPAPLCQALDDPRLSATTVRVYGWCLRNLDVNDWRAVRGFYVCATVHASRASVYSALAQLVLCGYLDRHEQPRHAPSLYRLFFSPRPMVPKLDTSHAA